MLSDQLRDLNAAGAAFRMEAQGVDSQGNPQKGVMEDFFQKDGTSRSFACYFSSGKDAESLQAMMLFKDTHDNVVRVTKTETNFDPTIGKVIRLIAANGLRPPCDLLVRIGEIQTSTLNPEYVCGCKAPTG